MQAANESIQVMEHTKMHELFLVFVEEFRVGGFGWRRRDGEWQLSLSPQQQTHGE